MTQDDRTLISRVVVDDDREAFGILVRRYQSALRGWLLRLTGGDKALSDDLAQETFIRAYRGLQRFEGRAAFATWLYRIAYHTFSGDRRRPHARPAEQEPLATATPHGYQADLNVDLTRALLTLSEAERATISLSYFTGLSHREVARVLDCPLGTVKTNILRGKQKLAAKLAAWRLEVQHAS